MHFVNLSCDHLNLKHMQLITANENIVNIEITIVISGMNNTIFF